jgi:hypothetical protein
MKLSNCIQLEKKQMESKPKFKYVMAKYHFEHRSVWKVPADWDNTKIYVKWDRISYGNFDDDETAKMVKQKRGYDCFEADFKRPDETTENPIEGCQRGLVFGNRKTIEDEGYYSCNDSGDEDEESDDEDEECDPKMNEELETESEPDDQPDDGWKY